MPFRASLRPDLTQVAAYGVHTQMLVAADVPGGRPRALPQARVREFGDRADIGVGGDQPAGLVLVAPEG